MSIHDNIIETFTEMTPNYEEIVNNELIRFWGISYKEFIRILLHITSIPDNANILDIATGTGQIPLTIKKSSNNGYRIHGLDITYSMLQEANQNLNSNKSQEPTKLTCASAMEMPYTNASFDLVFCGLATHHMKVSSLLSEIYRILNTGGKLSIADVGSTPVWNLPGVKLLIRTLAFGYYAYNEGPKRAWAEASSVSNVRSANEWLDLLVNYKFKKISIKKLKSRYFWIPSPIIIQAEK
jgi:ubiquinone/menaquinone biosynthesis C-methylase UbiE